MRSPASVCVLGTGAVGGLLGAAFVKRGHAVTFVDHGARLTDLQRKGLKVVGLDGGTATVANGEFFGPDSVSGQFDIVLLAVKAHQISELTNCLGRILGQETALLTLQNGLPWWYFQGCKSKLNGAKLQSLDPKGAIAAVVPAERIIGTVVYPAAEVLDDGTVLHVEGDRFVLGELNSTGSERVKAIADLITDAGFRGQVQTDIRAEIWLKSWGSLAFNTVSALTGSTMAGICRDTDAKALVTALMIETRAVANAVGVQMRVPLERRLAGAQRVGEHKTSMLQDIEAGRQTEVEAIIGSVIEIAKLAGVAMPKAEAVYALIKRLNDQVGEERARLL